MIVIVSQAGSTSIIFPITRMKTGNEKKIRNSWDQVDVCTYKIATNLSSFDVYTKYLNYIKNI